MFGEDLASFPPLTSKAWLPSPGAVSPVSTKKIYAYTSDVFTQNFTPFTWDPFSQHSSESALHVLT